MGGKFKVQIPRERYFEGYDHLKRFISYFYQTNLVKKLKPESVLEIGIGNKTVANYLKQQGVNIETCDFDQELEPDYIADIRELPFADDAYEAVVACEVLEHIPWEDVELALREIGRVTKRYVIISIPYATNSVEIIISSPWVERKIKRPLDWFIKLPWRPADIKFTGEHYWEMGRKSYPSEKIRVALRKYFEIVREVRPILDPYRYFFILEKKKSGV
jgi:SAM-dependent methyltransferase